MRSPSYTFPKTINKTFINRTEEHSKRIPSPTEYEKPMKWINNTARDLSKGSKRKTIIDQIFIEKKKIPSPTDYKNLMDERIIGSQMSKTQGFNFLSETEYLGHCTPSAVSYQINEKLVTKRCPGYKIVKPKDGKLSWKPVKSPGPAVGLYKTEREFILPKSPRTVIGKEKLKSVIESLAKDKKKVPGVGEYNTPDCFNKISRPMRTTRC